MEDKTTRRRTAAGKWLPIIALATGLLAGACSSGKSSPTEPIADAGSPAVSLPGSSATSDDSGSDSQFQGVVIAASPAQETLDLRNGLQIQTGFDTSWSSRGDVFSVAEIANALSRGVTVRVEGRGTTAGANNVLATSIKAETDEDGPGLGGDDFDDDSDGDSDVDSDGDSDFDDDSDGDSDDDSDDPFDGTAQFDGSVASVNRGGQSLQLRNGKVVATDGGTIWDNEGDLFSFTALADAFDAGRPVRVEGDGDRQPDGSILAFDIKAEVDD